jgi:ribosomal-protein-alanine N-acetyltransferase
MAITITDAREEQLPQLLQLERQCFSVPWTEAMLRAQLSSGDHVFLVAEEDGAVLGYAGLLFVLDEGYISNVAVAPAQRRRGVARALLGALERRAREKGLAFLTLEVRAGNAAAIALYAGCGYETVGRRKNYYEKPAEDALLMTRFLRKDGGSEEVQQK